MIHGKSLIARKYSSNSKGAFHAFNPETQEALDPVFFPATKNDVDEALSLARKAFNDNRTKSASDKVRLLETIAQNLNAKATDIISRAKLETGLPEARLQGELTRTTEQLRMFARLLTDGYWLEASINHGDPTRTPAPKPDLRKMLVPIGPVVVFGASNFPLAFSVAGGDTASALAAGNPVIVKAHPSHPGTSELVGTCIREAIETNSFAAGTFSLLQDSGFQIGQELVKHPDTKAAAFTGSSSGGKALFDLAVSRPEPIPFFAEMGSVNPVVVLSEIQEKEADKWATAFASSLNLGAGQFCTNPGLLLILQNKATENFLQKLSDQISIAPSQVMLNSGISSGYHKRSAEILGKVNKTLATAPASDTHKSRAIAGYVSAEDFIRNPDLAEEVFGPFTIVVACNDETQLLNALSVLPGQLTASLIGTPADLLQNKALVAQLEQKAGRLIFNGLPTGVEVNESMQHGGPFPATTDSRFTSVGTSAIKRFSRPVAWQDCPQDLLPDELKDENPLQIPRIINGKLKY